MRWGVRKKRRPTLAQGPRAADEAWAKAFCGTTNASQRANELLIAATTLDPVPVRFFWPPYFGFGKLSVVLAHSGDANGVLRSYLAATASVAGDFPNRRRRSPLCDVIIVSTKTIISEKILPQLSAANADLERVKLLRRDDEADFVASKERPRMTAAADTLDEDVLLLIDLRTEAHSAAEMVGSLGNIFRELSALARGLQNPVVAMLTAVNLREPDQLLKVAEALAALPTLDSVSLVAREDRFKNWLFVPVKNLVGHDAPCFGFRIRVKPGKGGVASVIDWDAGTVLPASTKFLISVRRPTKKRNALIAAKKFLQERLRAGPVAIKVLRSDAAQAEIDEIALDRARKDLGIRTEGQTWALATT